MGFGLDNQPGTPGGVALGNGVDILFTFTARPIPVNNAPRGEVRPIDKTHQLFYANIINPVIIVNQVYAGVNDFGQVVGRDAGGHTHRDTTGTVDQQVGQGRGQDAGFAQGVVKVLCPVDSILFQIIQNQIADPREPGFGVAHGRGVVAVDGAKIALAIHQRVAHTKVLGQAHHRIIDRCVAVGMVLAQHFANNTGTLFVRSVGMQPQVVHGIENTAMDGFQTISYIGQGTGHDYAHGVIEIGYLHFAGDVNFPNIAYGL